ncbi:hypothetical protein E2C01_022686 [Portunus trituberculatus]|uniref:MD-2-related lipid-recognition domain-containing protein n=1 Tax=Portunus trituberculatus TaxID=210409 RepID=A0A5B7E9J0_PORTR|nr:hypothetical protein [Portunus trituberculatus]
MKEQLKPREYNSSNVDSYVRWNSWMEVPLPEQQRDACDGEIACPVEEGQMTQFTYSLHIQNYWPRQDYHYTSQHIHADSLVNQPHLDSSLGGLACTTPCLAAAHSPPPPPQKAPQLHHFTNSLLSD